MFTVCYVWCHLWCHVLVRVMTNQALDIRRNIQPFAAGAALTVLVQDVRFDTRWLSGRNVGHEAQWFGVSGLKLFNALSDVARFSDLDELPTLDEVDVPANFKNRRRCQCWQQQALLRIDRGRAPLSDDFQRRRQVESF